MKYSQMDYDLFNEWFYVDSSSATGLRRKKDSPPRNNGTSRSLKDAEAGSRVVVSNGKPTAWSIKLFDKVYLVHRVVWLLTYKELPDLFIDHIDQNPLNNSLSNLRLVSQEINSRNVKKHITNRSGITGVFIREDQQSAVAHWKDIEGNSRQKQFGFVKHGKEQAIEKAIHFRNTVIMLLNQCGQGYTQQHGT